MRLPAELSEFRWLHRWRSVDFGRCFPFQGSMYAVVIVVVLELFEFSLQIPGIPEHEVIKEFPANGADESLNKGM